MGCKQWCVFETVCGEFFLTGQSSFCTNLTGLCRQPRNQECDWGEGGESVWNDSELMGWERQGGHQLLFRTLFLTHVGVSSHVQMWTFQKVPSQIAQFPFSAVPNLMFSPIWCFLSCCLPSPFFCPLHTHVLKSRVTQQSPSLSSSSLALFSFLQLCLWPKSYYKLTANVLINSFSHLHSFNRFAVLLSTDFYFL